MFDSINKTFKKISSTLQISQSTTAAVAILQTLTIACDLTNPYLLGKSIGELYEGDSETGTINSASIYYLSAFSFTLLASKLFPAISKIFTNSLKKNYSLAINHEMNHKFSELDLQTINARPVGMFVQMLRQSYETENAVPLLLEDIFPSSFELLLADAGLCGLNWQLGLTLIGSQTLSYLFIYFNTKNIKVLYEAEQESGLQMYSKTISRIQDHPNIHLAGRAEYEIDDGYRDLTRFREKGLAVLNSPEYGTLIQNVWNTFTVIGLVTFAAYKLNSKEIPVDYIAMITIYSIQLINLLARLNRSVAQLAICEAGMDKIAGFLAQQPNIREAINPQLFRFTSTTATIRFENVTFSYDRDGREKIFDNASFTIEAGRRTAIVGLSGSGKSTLAMLIARFIQPQSGKIYINGIDIQVIKLKSLRSVLGIVLQNPRLPNTTLREALNYMVKEDISDAQLIERLKQVRLNQFANIEGLNQKLNEGGGRLSGGQQQRLAILRAMLKEPFIYILDEATSGLDMESANDIQQMLEEHTAGATVLTITHQLLSIANSDHIMVIENGKVIQQGDFTSLKNEEGRFKSLLKNFCAINKVKFSTLKIAADSKQVPKKKFRVYEESTQFNFCQAEDSKERAGIQYSELNEDREYSELNEDRGSRKSINFPGS